MKRPDETEEAYAARIEAEGRQKAAIEALALQVAPAILSGAGEIVTGLADLLTGRTTIAIQSIERPVEEREDAGLGQWDHYVRVIQADDADETAGQA